MRIVEAFPSTGFTYPVIYRIMVLNSDDEWNDGYFFRRLKGDLATLITYAVRFGLLIPSGEDGQGETIYTRYEPDAAEESAQKALSVDAGFTVTIFRALSFTALTSMLPFLELMRYDTAALYAINRKSCIRAFDAGMTPETITSLLTNASTHEVPRNLAVSLNDWYDTYCSIRLYKGYVLCVAEDRRGAFERNPHAVSIIHKVLSPGVYFCTFNSDAEAAKLIEKTMATSIGKTVTAEEKNDGDAESILWEDDPLPPFSLVKGDVPLLPARQEGGGAVFISKMQDELKTRGFTSAAYEALKDRIERHLILNAEQLRPETVHYEKTEAAGMDFLGKLHFIEDAITRRELLEFSLGQEGSPQARQVLAHPVWLKKGATDAYVTVTVEPSKTSEQYSVAKLRGVRKMRASIFQDLRPR
jgi:hypothetical protein